MENNDIKIFLGTQEIAGMIERLHRAFDEMNVKNDFFCLVPYAFSGERSNSMLLRRYWKHKQNIENKERKVKLCVSCLGSMVDLLGLFVYAIKNYNAYIYICGSGIFSHNAFLKHFERVEFFILRLLKKKVVIFLCGSDSRAPYCDGMEGSALQFMRATRKKRKKIRMLEKSAILIDNPASSHFHTQKYIIVQSIGIPIDINEVVDREKCNEDKVVILHAPSNKKWKGTSIIRETIHEIKRLGFPVEYVEVSGLSHSEVLRKMRQCDLVVDQMYSDTPMAGLATEAAMNAIPTVVCGYFSEYYRNVLRKPIPPTIYCDPSNLKEQLIRLIQNKEEREKLGKEAQQFVMDNWNSKRCAQRFIDIFSGIYSEEWLYEPKDNKYIWGWGVSKEQVKRNVVSMVDKYGMKSLGLSPDTILYQEYYKLYCSAKKGEGKI